MKKIFSFTIMILLINLNLPIYSQNKFVDNSFEKVQKLGTLKVCSQAGFIPFEMKDNKGNWKGFDVDIMTEFAKQNSIKLQLIDTTLDGLIPALMTGKCDMIASGLTITEERKKAVLFSKPVFTVIVSAALLNTAENRSKYKTFLDIDSKGTKIATHTGSAATLYLKTILKNANHLQFDTESDEVNAVVQKRTNVFVEDNVFIAQASKEMKIDFYTLLSEEKGDLAMAVRKKDNQLVEKFNDFLDKLKKNGQYDSIKKNYFN
ncbi:MAG: transporter substrate-binding domain-containing protein [Silvanigrellaceae bacterium]|nr:transporter substrate-binding domain-containing protein [Silvanigrellaceae bacterium]